MRLQIILHNEALLEFPRRGRIVPEFNKDDVRELIFHNYRLVYKVENENIYVVSVAHGSMDLVEKSKKEEWEIG